MPEFCRVAASGPSLFQQLEEITGARVSIVAVGPDRKQTIVRHQIFA